MTVKEIREQTGLSQSEFSKKVGIPVSTIQKWEQGVYSVKPYTLAYLRLRCLVEPEEDTDDGLQD